MARPGRQTRGALKPQRKERTPAAETAAALLRMAAPDGTAVERFVGSPAQSLLALDALSITPDRLQQLGNRVLGLSERALAHVGHHLLAVPLGEEMPASVKSTTTVAAILVDKFLLIQQQIQAMEGRSGTATVSELNDKARRLLEITEELEKRGRAVDVTPK